MKKLVLGITFLAAVALFSACSSKRETVDGEVSAESPAESDGQAYHRITAKEAKSMIDEGGVTIVDVRREDEYKAGHIPGAILVPNETIDEEAAEALPDKDAILLIHCRTGIRSKQASDKLVEMGYQHIYDFGGIVDWPYDTITEK